MSSPGNPSLSTIVRGTSNTTDIYFLDAGARRLIPDDQTLSYLLGGQSVTVMSDADLAAIPLGAPLPSRKDGQLLAQFYAFPPPGQTYYFMAGGMRRPVPDIPTFLALKNSGVATVTLDAADLNEIPVGQSWLTLPDGALYKGVGKIFAFAIQGAHKRAVPDATTLRDLGYSAASLITAAASDLALVADGDPFPSSSRFLNPPAAEIPLVLLPVRLETRFQGTQLWLRIFPDDVHVNSFEPELTDEERAARSVYIEQAAARADAAKAAFAAMARQLGGERAAWVANTNDPSASKASQWSRAPFTNVLPERWIVIGYQGNAAGQVLAVGPAIADSLAVGLAPDSASASDSGTKWITDFDQAIQAGMGFRIDLTPEQQRGFKRLLVIGLKTTLSATDSAARLGYLLQAHHYTDGVELLALNTPTNNTEEVASGFSAKTAYDALFSLELGPALCPSSPAADGDRLARALGIDPAMFAHIRGANGTQDEQARAMNTVMWPATWGYYLSQIVTGSVPTPDVLLPAARDHFAENVRARGHFPTVRIGQQPYGILPVCWSASWQSLEGRTLDAPLSSLLAQMRTTWENSIANVPRLPGASDAEAALVSLLGMTPSSDSFVARNVIGPEYVFSYWDFVQNDIAKTWWTTLAQKSLAEAGNFAAVMANTRLANSTYSRLFRPLSDVIVAPAPLDGTPSPAYVSQLASLGWRALRDVAMPNAPVPLLFLLLRHAALREYLDTALDLLTTAGAAQPQERIEAELFGISSAATRATSWDILQRELPGEGPVGIFLDSAKQNASLPNFVAFWNALSLLAQYSASDLDALTREVFDLASYRLDAWITSLAYFRLDTLRGAQPKAGILLGAYGWVENVQPQTAPPSSGFIHAPSLNQATAAAVMRSGYLAHRNDPEKPFEIDLSSARVRLAMHLLDGIRSGQSLGALLGYRLERTLHDTNLDVYIAPLRAMAQLEVGAGTSEVVDGLALLRSVNSDPNFWNAAGLPAAGTTDRDGVTAAINAMDDALDATADLALTESVHQLIRGNMVRAGATLDSIARGDTPPTDVDVVQTPRSGAALTYRLLSPALGTTAPGWTETPRAQAEPRLNSWAASLLGDPGRVRIRAQFVDGAGKMLSAMEIGLDQIGVAPLDVLSLPETEGVGGELAARILHVVSRARPADVPADSQIEIVTGRDPHWSADVVAVTEWLGLLHATSRLVNAARPLDPKDIVAPDDTAGTIDSGELQHRADAAETQLRAALSMLQDASANDSALMTSAAFGVANAAPMLDPSNWPQQIAAAAAELKSRTSGLDKLAAGFDRTGASANELRDHDVARLQLIFGKSFQVLPVLAADAAASWPMLWENSLSLQEGDPLTSIRWFQRAARVRPGATRLDTAILFAESLTGVPFFDLQVAQLPFAATDKWMALEASAPPTAGQVSLMAFSPTAYTAGAAIAGLMIDEWIEVWPAPLQTTGVSFQYTDPSTRAPQAILLAVRPDDFPEWTMEAVEGSVLEALSLAAIRAVDPDALGALGHYLPALYFAFNSGGPVADVVSTNFNVALRSFASDN